MTASANPLSDNSDYIAREFGVNSSIWSHPRQNLQARALLSISAQTVGKDQCHTGLDELVVYGDIWRTLFLYSSSHVLMLKLHPGYYSINAVQNSNI